MAIGADTAALDTATVDADTMVAVPHTPAGYGADMQELPAPLLEAVHAVALAAAGM